MIKLNPLTLKQLKRFKQIKRGYWSLIILSAMLFLSLIAEVLINSKALVVRYQGDYYFPIVSD
ncbi:ABC transporter permease, partial [Vibrio splendidus]